jgi:hypothetical protein
MFRSTTIIRELTLSLAKAIFIKSVKVRRYGPRGGVAAFYIKSIVMCVLCAVCSAECTAHSTHQRLKNSSTYLSECQFIIKPGTLPFTTGLIVFFTNVCTRK